MIRTTIAAAFMLFTALGAGSAQAQSTLKVGTEANGLPFSFVDPKTNQPDGFMVDVIKAVGKEAGFAVTVEPMEFSALISSLTSGKIDLTSAAMYITPKRQKVIDFSDPIFGYGEGMIVRKDDNKDYTSFNELPGETVGAQLGTLYVAPLQQANIFSEVKVYDTVQNMMQDVNAGRIKAGFADYPIMSYFLAKGQFPNVKLVKTYKPVVPGEIGIGIPKDKPELLKSIDDALVKLKANGKLDELTAKWNLK
ncbi:ABC transporter substrate-binding protein [Mesorhizobium sp. M0518]|uniref:ABC transporter substrate-binding protein n=1 Tax=Mesorhizobium sp. M0518 TaxID=2956956 RepID=UPI00333D0AB5